MKKLQLFILFALIGSGIIKGDESTSQCAMVYGTASLAAMTSSIYGLGKFCHYKSGAPTYDISSLSSYFHNHGDYPTYFHGKNSTATSKQKNLSRAASILLKTSSSLKVPCYWFGAITILAVSESH